MHATKQEGIIKQKNLSLSPNIKENTEWKKQMQQKNTQ